MASTVHAAGSCSICHRDLVLYGNPNGGRYCDACGVMLRRNPHVDPATKRNGRSEQVPQERPVRDRRWRSEARCAGAPWELFEYAPLENAVIPRQLDDVARVFCADCPVRAACKSEADEHRYEGLWAGSLRYLTPRSRYVVRDLLARKEVA